MVRNKRLGIRIRRSLNHSGRRVLSTTGFTLIEVVVAMAILGIGMTVLLELFSGSLRLLRTSGEYTKAVNYARVKMEEITVKPTVNEGIEEGEFDGAYRWQVDVKRVDVLPPRIETDFKPPVELFQVKLIVLWKSGTKERSTVLETYRTIKLEEEEKKELKE
jgi:general secretion pathway protein I